jgi:hypothetical protein
MARGRKRVEKEDGDENEDDDVDDMEVDDEQKVSDGCKKSASQLKDVRGNLIVQSIQNKSDFANRDTTLTAMSIELLQKSEQRGSCFYINEMPLDIIQIAGKIVNRINVFENRVTFLLADDCAGALNSLMCVFWQINTVNFDKHILLLSKKHVRVTGVLDFDDRIIMNVYNIQAVNSGVELTYHALLVKYHAMKRSVMPNALQAMSKRFNKVEDSLVSSTNFGASTVVEQLSGSKVVEQRFYVTPVSVKSFLVEMNSNKTKKFHYEKVYIVFC